MRFKYLFLITTSVCLLQSCYLLPTNPKNTVENYLAALHDNNEQKREFRCFPSDLAANPDPELEIKSWSVVSQEEEIQEHDPDSKFFEVSAKVEYVSKAGFTVTRTLLFDVWDSDALFESSKRRQDKVSRLIEDSRQKTNAMRQALGEPLVEHSNAPATLLDRSKISSNTYCITAIKEFGF